MNILSIVGARPQFIKAFAVSQELRTRYDEVLVHTGQHYDEELSGVFFDTLGIPEPDYNLGVGSDSHGKQTAEMLAQLEELIEEEQPDVVLLYGDTNSTLAGALAGAKVDPAVAHVEAGLRSHNRDMPEEINRILSDHASDLLFAPSERAVEHLASEGITENVYNVGDVMYDALLLAQQTALTESTLLTELGLDKEPYLLATIHRPQNTDNRERLETILNTLAADPRSVVFPAHPRTVDRLEQYDLLSEVREQLTVIDPVGYLEFIMLQANADIVVTDSGSIQKEAFFLDVPCVTLREETEWPETIDTGGNVLVGSNRVAIRNALANPPDSISSAEPYGDGNAAKKIRQILTNEIE